jgi:nucleotide-binding universal stress UspA family protein
MSNATPERTHEQVEDHRPDPMFVPKRIIAIPIDESDSSKHVVEYTLSTLIQKSNDQVVLLHTRPPAFNEFNVELGYPYIIPNSDLEKAEQSLRHVSHTLLKQTAKKFQDQGVHVRAISLRGDPREELEHKINTLKPDFVVMGSRGLNMISRVLLGSVSEHLIHHSTVPVMVVPFQKQ